MCEAGDVMLVYNCRLLPDGLHRRDHRTVDLGPDRPPLGSPRCVSAACVAGADLQSPPVASLGDPAHQCPQTQVCKIIVHDKSASRRSSNTVQPQSITSAILRPI